MKNTLFNTHRLGENTLNNRVVMAPLTRNRAVGNQPNEIMAKYYGQRATAGLIITEGVAPSPNGAGYPRMPGIWNETQKEGWKAVADSGSRRRRKNFHANHAFWKSEPCCKYGRRNEDIGTLCNTS